MHCLEGMLVVDVSMCVGSVYYNAGFVVYVFGYLYASCHSRVLLWL